MKAPYYTVKAEIKKFWFNPSKVVYVLQEHYTDWIDPSYGNGGGSYENCVRVLDRSEDRSFIQDLCDTLNKYNGEVK